MASMTGTGAGPALVPVGGAVTHLPTGRPPLCRLPARPRRSDPDARPAGSPAPPAGAPLDGGGGREPGAAAEAVPPGTPGRATPAGWSFRDRPPTLTTASPAGFVVEIALDVAGFRVDGRAVPPRVLAGHLAAVCPAARPLLVVPAGEVTSAPAMSLLIGALADALGRPVVAGDPGVRFTGTGLALAAETFRRFHPRTPAGRRVDVLGPVLPAPPSGLARSFLAAPTPTTPARTPAPSAGMPAAPGAASAPGPAAASPPEVAPEVAAPVPVPADPEPGRPHVRARTAPAADRSPAVASGADPVADPTAPSPLPAELRELLSPARRHRVFATLAAPPPATPDERSYPASPDGSARPPAGDDPTHPPTAGDPVRSAVEAARPAGGAGAGDPSAGDTPAPPGPAPAPRQPRGPAPPGPDAAGAALWLPEPEPDAAPDRAAVRQALNGRYDAHARIVARRLSEDPGLRAVAGSAADIVAGLVAVRAYLLEERDTVNRVLRGHGDETERDQVALLARTAAYGLQRLPSVFGPVFRATAAGHDVLAGYRPGDELAEPAFLDVDLAAAPVDPEAAVEIAIWSVSARRVSGLGVGDAALFPPGARFTVLAVDRPDGRGEPARVLLRDLAAAHRGRGGSDDLERVLARLREAPRRTRSRPGLPRSSYAPGLDEAGRRYRRPDVPEMMPVPEGGAA
ncbi:hypothetical protein AB0J86_31015 [Micromonospora sp. NPDC049559]|uniref:hypothetical protein n=1 Tax=Micromonospora sp. NPDC049559 TaxID=3155923 RepID=UPI003440CC77